MSQSVGECVSFGVYIFRYAPVSASDPIISVVMGAVAMAPHSHTHKQSGAVERLTVTCYNRRIKLMCPQAKLHQPQPLLSQKI